MILKWAGLLLFFKFAIASPGPEWTSLALGVGAPEEGYGEFGDPATIEKFVVAQVFRARLNDTFPTIPLFRANPSLDFYKLRGCPRAEVARCLRYGEFVDTKSK
jgi:hypothetical protein